MPWPPRSQQAEVIVGESIEVSLRATSEEIFRLLEDMAQIKEQIARAKGNAAERGDYSDADWFHSANRALKHKQIEHQKLMARQSALKRAAKDQRIKESNRQSLVFERAFMDNAKLLLPTETYEALIESTRLSIADGGDHAN
jgi:hypothetical protein